MEIRHATAADEMAIATLHAESWRSAYRGIFEDEYLDEPVYADRQALWQTRFHSPRPDQCVLVAHDNERIVGFACAYGGEDATWGTYLDNLHVAPSRKGEGIGTALLARVAAWSLAEYHGRGMFLWVFAENLPARAFYSQLGAGAADESEWTTASGSSVRQVRYVWDELKLAALVRKTR